MSVAKGAAVTNGDCNPRRCHYLVVTVSGFAPGSHRVTCYSARAGIFGAYATSQTVSAVCTDGRREDTVWAVVDGVRSPSLAW